MVDISGRRKYPRVPARLEVRYARRNTFFADYTQNISQGGLFVATDTPLELGTVFQFDMHIPDVPEPLSLTGEVRWSVQPSDDEDLPVEPGMGIAFKFESDDERQSVDEFVEHLMRDSLGDHIVDELLSRMVED